jgi:hypothetical protein
MSKFDLPGEHNPSKLTGTSAVTACVLSELESVEPSQDSGFLVCV